MHGLRDKGSQGIHRQHNSMQGRSCVESDPTPPFISFLGIFRVLSPDDFGLAADGVAPEWGSLICGKNITKEKRKKLCYKGLIVVVSGIDSLEVEPVVRLIQEVTI